MSDEARPAGNGYRYVAMAVKFLDHPALTGKYDRRSALLWLIANAAWKDHPTWTRAGEIVLKRGEIIVARDHLAKVWGWTASEVRSFLANLTTHGVIEYRQRNSQYANVATVCNYDKYQKPTGGGNQRDRQPNASETANEVATEIATEIATQYQSTNLPKNNPPTPKGARKRNDAVKAADTFGSFWQHYPRREAKASAQKAFAKLSDTDQTLAVERAERFAKRPDVLAKLKAGDERYIPHAATWLNGRRFDDEPEHQAGPQAQADMSTIHRKAVSLFHKTGKWDFQFGPEPNERGCKLPPEILAEFGYGPNRNGEAVH
jgi:hypothetical protein